MPDYIVKVRNKNGSSEDVSYSAENRTELFKSLKGNGVSVVSVREASPRKQFKSNGIQLKKIVLTVFILVFVLGLTMWFIRDNDENPNNVKKTDTVSNEVKKNKISKIKEKNDSIDSKVVNSNVVINTQTKEEKKPKLTRSQLRDLKNGRHFYPPAYTSKVVRVSKEARLFKSPSDQWIAVALTVEPGTPMLMDPESIFNERFKKKFQDSLNTKIEILDTDDPYDKELKQMVIDTKKELAARVKAGEDVCEIMKTTFNELKQLALYKQELETLVKESIRKNDTTDKDCEEILEAANKMLKDRGIEEMKMPGFYRKKIKLMQKRKGNQK